MGLNELMRKGAWIEYHKLYVRGSEIATLMKRKDTATTRSDDGIFKDDGMILESP